MDAVKAIEWWLEREGPDCVPAIEIGVSSEVRSLREDMASAADEIERLRAALAPFAAVDVDSMLSLEEADLDKEDFYRARIAFTGEQKLDGEK